MPSDDDRSYADSSYADSAHGGDAGPGLSRRLPLYAYLEPLLTGRRILEIGAGSGAGAEYLASRGATRVVSIDTDGFAIDRARARHRRANLEFRTVADLLAPAA